MFISLLLRKTSAGIISLKALSAGLWLALLLASQTLPGAELTPALEDQLRSASDLDQLSAIVILESPVDIRALDERLHVQRAPLAQRHREVIEALKYNAAVSQPSFIAELEQAKRQGLVTGYTAYWIENLFVVSAAKDFINSLRSRTDIRYITENFRIEPIPDAGIERDREVLDEDSTTEELDIIGATQVRSQLGISGAGTIVATLDVGVDYDHPALAARWRGLTAPVEECWLDAVGNGYAIPQELGGHGNHVMGTICGQAINGADTLTIGVAPGAVWIASNAANQGGGVSLDNDVLESLQWFADPDGNPLTLEDMPDVVQNSWGVNSSLGYPDCYDFWNSAIQNCEAVGVVIIFSAGNEGPFGLRSPAKYELNSTQVFSVGAVDTDGETPPYPIANFSSTGPSDCPPAANAIKPELVAPGVNIISCNSTGGYAVRSGTSFSSPHVAGTVALMREACPDCDPITIKQVLMNTATDQGAVGPDNVFGAGVLNTYAAVTAALGLGRVCGHIESPTGQPLEHVVVMNLAGGENSQSDISGDYSLALPAGTYSLSYTRYDHFPATQNNVVITSGQETTIDVTLVPRPTAVVSGIVTCFGQPSASGAVRVLNVPIPTEITDAGGYYSITVPLGTWNFRAGADGCDSLTISNAIINGDTTIDFPLAYDLDLLCAPPDTFGYGACESGDVDGPPFSWLEISPLAGGPGLPTGMNGDDQAVQIQLPFTFRIYGQDYSACWICSNGFVSFDSSSTLHNNRELPIADMGHAVVVYWDDWYPLSGGGDISYYYFPAADAMVIEWYNLEHFPGAPPRETFQVWLFNVLTNPSPAGDSQIRLQYLNADSTSSTTIGLQNGTTAANQYWHIGTAQPYAQGVRPDWTVAYGGFQPVRGLLEGVVTDCFGQPAGGALVTFPGFLPDSAICDIDGAYLLHVDAGTVNVRAAKLPCSSVLAENVVIVAGQTTVLNLTLNPQPTLSGVVTDCRGFAAASVIVQLSGELEAGDTTDANGFYFFAVTQGIFNLSTDNEFCSTVEQEGIVVDDGGHVIVDLTLNPPPSISGTILDCRGGFAAGSLVELPGSGIPPVFSDSIGFYRFEVVPDTYVVRADNEFCSTIESPPVVIADGEALTVDLTLAPPPALTGIIIHCNGEPAIGATVWLPGTEIPATTSDGAGRYFFALAPGVYSVSADQDPCSAVRQDDNMVTDGDTTYVSLTLLPPSAIQGTVTSCTGGPAAFCDVTFPGSDLPAVQTNLQGFFFVEAYPGTFSVRADNAFCSAVAIDSFALGEGDTITVNLTLRGPAVVHGTVTHCFGGHAVGVQVELIGNIAISTETDSLGQFEFTVIPDTFSLRADNASCSRVETLPFVVQDGDTLAFDLTLNPPPRLEGYVTSCYGGAASSATVTLLGTEYPPVITEVSGFYSFTVTDDIYQVTASGDGCTPSDSVTVEVGDGEIVTADLTLRAPASVEGTVYSCFEGVAVGATVRLLYSALPPRQTNSAGFYRFDSLAAGEYWIAAGFAGCRAETAHVSLQAGETATQGLQLVVDSSYSCLSSEGYGYSVCEDVDEDGPLFQWREIAPAAGGNGTLLTLGDDETSSVMSLPFPVQLFGVTHTEYSISSDGYISFGWGVSDPNHLCMPVGAFPPTLFAYWADLDPAVLGAEVAVKHDTSSQLLIIEWFNVEKCCVPGERVTAQVILRDRLYYPTITGDNEIVLQYNSPVPDGELVTVGIQNSDGSAYYQHLCDGLPGPYSAGIDSGRAIEFSTGRAELTVDVNVQPAQIIEQLPVGANGSTLLQICNSGTALPLNWALSYYQFSPPDAPGLGRVPSVEHAAEFRNRDALDSRGGPDPSGYSWVDSQEPDGPIYSWVEIRNSGINTNLHADNQILSVALPWPYEFYGIVYNNIYISTNGNAHFNDPSFQHFNRVIPSSVAPDAMFAVMWDDLTTAAFGNIYYLNDEINNRFIVEWDSVGRTGGGGTYTFELIISRNGPAIYQYKSLTGIVNSASVGIENSQGNVGLQVVYNANYLVANRAIRFGTFSQWLRTPAQSSGVLPAGQCTTLTFQILSSSLAAGSYAGQFVLQTNDADENPLIVPVQLLVGALEAPTGLSLGYESAGETLTLRWSDSGAPYYRVLTGIGPDGPFVTPIATTSETFVTVPMPPDSKLFYVVVAADTP